MMRFTAKRILCGLATAVMAAVLTAPIPTPAMAEVKIIIQIGPGYGLAPRPGRLSCQAVGNRLWNKGYRNIRVIDCRGLDYVYDARRDGHKWRVHLSSINGSVKRRILLR
jgi:hypothetical protein